MLLYCDDWENDIPYRATAKLAGTYPLPWDMSVSASFQSLAGRPLGLTTTTGNKISGPGYGDVGSPVGTNWLLTRATRYPADCPAPCPAGALVVPTLTSASVTVPLVAPGTEFLPRFNQLDVSFAKSFQVGMFRVTGQMDIFNALNASTVTAYRSTNYATTSYVQPSSVLQGRFFRFGTQLRW
jgi:hypothetical protein